jgi:hypothetical protein
MAECLPANLLIICAKPRSAYTSWFGAISQLKMDLVFRYLVIAENQERAGGHPG